jgi:transcription-repair coupling factor (superfamily II helicase)
VSLDPVRARLRTSGAVAAFPKTVRAIPSGGALRVKGAAGSLPAFLLADVADARQQAKQKRGPMLCLLPDTDAAAYLRSDLEQLLGGDAPLLFFPPTGRKPYDRERVADAAPLTARADVLQQLQGGYTGVIVASLDAVSELVAPPNIVQQETETVAVGDEVAPDDLMAHLVDQGFLAVEFVAEPGEVALRGGILDVFPFAGDYPVRIEFFGDEVDAIREFEPGSQRSIAQRESARLVPDLDAGHTDLPYTSLFEYLPEYTLLALFDSQRLGERTAELFEQAEEGYAARLEHDAAEENAQPVPAPTERFLQPDTLADRLADYPKLQFGLFSDDADETVTISGVPQPDFNGHIGRLRETIQSWEAGDAEVFLLCDSASQRSRLRDLLGVDDEDSLLVAGSTEARLLVESLHEGFEVPEAGLVVYTDHQIFNRYHRPTGRKRRKTTGGLSLRELKALQPGDFVVHIDYGIGKFAGLNHIEVRGKKQEAVRMLFGGGDELFVNVNALHKLHKYTGKEGHQPKLTKLGSGQWERLKSRTKKRVKDVARDLIKLYAARKAAKGFAFKRDTVWQRELEASFEFEDTPDQGAAAEATKEDMELPTPMDRLVCGDVGFGKTEIAVRAAFKAAQEGKQVAVIVPTTILASQHYNTFTRRMERFPVKVAQLSRFVPKEKQKETLEQMKKGEVDIVIGTHRLVSKDVKWKDLGLLIIDEEQRFGVKTKEKLRKLRPNIDTLTLTATPIPRTLQFSLMGARDLSIIATPPPNRQPIVTEIHTYDPDLIRDALLYETNRGGQAFFIHNRVQSIEEVAARIRALIPSIRVRVAHGQMPPTDLEGILIDFIDGKFDVLVCTNIVESGVDVSNANTIIINHAERFGLSDLHQLRGRVGRNDQKAFCYLLVPSVHTLTREARQRLKAVEEFSDLGSGFNIAMRDLDIRGAGSLLGAEQSGFIEDVGYETYHKILDEAVQELRAEEFADVFEGEDAIPPGPDTVVDLDADALLPTDYVTNNVERLNLYRRLAEMDATDTEELDLYAAELEDRFGALPKEVQSLLASVRLKGKLLPLRLVRVLHKNERLWLDFPKQEEDAYFFEHTMPVILQRLAGLKQRYVLKETKSGRLRVIVQNVPTLKAANQVADVIAPREEPVAA